MSCPGQWIGRRPGNCAPHHLRNVTSRVPCLHLHAGMSALEYLSPSVAQPAAGTLPWGDDSPSTRCRRSTVDMPAEGRRHGTRLGAPADTVEIVSGYSRIAKDSHFRLIVLVPFPQLRIQNPRHARVLRSGLGCQLRMPSFVRIRAPGSPLSLIKWTCERSCHEDGLTLSGQSLCWCGCLGPKRYPSSAVCCAAEVPLRGWPGESSLFERHSKHDE